MLICRAGYCQEQSLWERYKSRFISEDGRVIDYGQAKSSHSEGQGYGMLLAVGFNDRATFDKLWNWTRNNLRIRTDDLFAWRWGERANGKWEIIDYNNATDGDILIASALIRAAKKWNDNNYLHEAIKTIRSIREKLAVYSKERVFILPGYYGFIRKDSLILNPSYLILPAYRSFAQVEEKVFWKKAYEDALSLLSQARFSSFALPPDWVVINNQQAVALCSEKSEYFGDEAARIFLYLSAEEKQNFSEGVKKILNLYGELGFIPAYIDLVKESISSKPASAGFHAIYAQAAQKMGYEKMSKELLKKAQEMLNREEDNYYSFSLYLLSKVWEPREGS
jgi:endoglucanase